MHVLFGEKDSFAIAGVRVALRFNRTATCCRRRPRWEEPVRTNRASKGYWHAIRDDPYPLIATGLGAAIPEMLVLQFLAVEPRALPPVPCAVLVGRDASLLLHRSPRAAAFSGEQPVARADGGRGWQDLAGASGPRNLADRAHLFVDSHDGAMFCRMPREQRASSSR